MNAHTQGEWFVESGSVRILADDPRATIVCEVTGSAHNPQSIADAHLIAAAPILLKELEHLVYALRPWLAAGRNVPGIANINEAERAIAKATQDEPRYTITEAGRKSLEDRK